MRILWLTVDRSKRVARHFDEFKDAVKQYADVVELVKDPLGDGGVMMGRASTKLVNRSLTTKDIVLDYLEKDWTFNFIFCDAFFAYMNERFDLIDIPKGILIEDVHGEVPKAQIDMAYNLGFECIFHRYNFAFHKIHQDSRFKFKCIWLPHSVNLDKFNFSNEKKIKVLHTGSTVQRYYPHRDLIVKNLLGKPYFTYMKRPQDWMDQVDTWPSGEEYYEVLSSAEISITGGSIFDIPTLKYVEIPAAKSLLMSNWFPGLGLMGFYPDKNMVTYTDETLVEDLESLMNNSDKVKEITEAGYNLIKSRHSTDVRAKQFINNISMLVWDKVLHEDVPLISNQINFDDLREPEVQDQVQESRIESPRAVFRSRRVIEQVRQSEPKKIVQGRVAGTDWRSRIVKAEAK